MEVVFITPKYGQWTVKSITDFTKVSEKCPKHYTENVLKTLPYVYFCSKKHGIYIIVSVDTEQKTVSFINSGGSFYNPTTEILEIVLDAVYEPVEEDLIPATEFILDVQNKCVVFDLTNQEEMVFFTSFPWWIPDQGKEILCAVANPGTMVFLPFRVGEDTSRLISVLAFRNISANLIIPAEKKYHGMKFVYELTCARIGSKSSGHAISAHLRDLSTPKVQSKTRFDNIKNVYNPVSKENKESPHEKISVMTLSGILSGEYCETKLGFYIVDMDIPINIKDYSIDRILYDASKDKFVFLFRKHLLIDEKEYIIK